MIIEIINVGTELLLGEIVNTNAVYLQKLCKDLGFHVYHQTVVGDNPERLKDCFDIAFERGADWVITTGGLGPTADDVTKELTAEYLGLTLQWNTIEAKKVKDKCTFVTGRDTITENNYKQAMFPKECVILENELGTANACVMYKDNKKIINLPGPPKELQYVIEYSLKPYLLPYKKDRIYTKEYTTIIIGESKIADLLKDVIDQQKEVSIALYASEESVRIRLGCIASNKEEADLKMYRSRKRIERKLDDYLIQGNSLKEALFAIMPPYHFYYHSSLIMRPEFVLGKEMSTDDTAMKIEINTISHRLGEIVEVTLNYQDSQYQFKIPLLKKATLSYPKLEARLMQNIYIYLKQLNEI
jgi:Predicted nucleotide-utilizing enzyme related to molybdopterin-biosynthesis enzyme MoeA